MSSNVFSSNLLPSQGEVLLLNGFMDSKDSANALEQLKTEIQWRHEPIWMFGKKVMQPRLTAWYGDEGKSYRYSGINMVPLPWTESLNRIKQRVEQLSGHEFNSVLLNQYRDGKDSMGWHRDHEPELGEDPVIASVSLGEPRRFLMRLYADHSMKKEILLENSSLLIMKGETQTYWEHSIPKSSKASGVRINLTFRKII